MTFRACIKSMRLRTLPLSLSGIVMGSSLAAASHTVSIPTLVFLALTTVCLQILSNLSNELGDTLHGVDTEQRAGIRYSLQDGDMGIADMKRLIGVMVALCCVFGLLMIRFAFGKLLSPIAVLFVLLGASAIWAAMRYTLGKHPYGYAGLGDIFVFIFFGVTSVAGAYFVCARTWDDWSVLLPVASIGLFSVAVLNVNNIRDMLTDRASRTTVAMRLGDRRARIYQTVLIVLGWVAMIIFTLLRGGGITSWLFVLVLPMFVMHLKGVWTLEDRDLDPMLPLLVMGSFLFSALSALGFLL